MSNKDTQVNSSGEMEGCEIIGNVQDIEHGKSENEGVLGFVDAEGEGGGFEGEGEGLKTLQITREEEIKAELEVLYNREKELEHSFKN